MENAVLAQIRSEILSEENVRRYVELIIQQAQNSTQQRAPQVEAVMGALVDVDARLRRWEDALERGELATEHAAQRIRELHVQRGQLLKKQSREALSGAGKGCPNPHRTNEDLHQRNASSARGEADRIQKKEFLREIVKEIRSEAARSFLPTSYPSTPNSRQFPKGGSLLYSGRFGGPTLDSNPHEKKKRSGK